MWISTHVEILTRMMVMELFRKVREWTDWITGLFPYAVMDEKPFSSPVNKWKSSRVGSFKADEGPQANRRYIVEDDKPTSVNMYLTTNRDPAMRSFI
jgi:hypothetical protein